MANRFVFLKSMAINLLSSSETSGSHGLKPNQSDKDPKSPSVISLSISAQTLFFPQNE